MQRVVHSQSHNKLLTTNDKDQDVRPTTVYRDSLRHTNSVCDDFLGPVPELAASLEPSDAATGPYQLAPLPGSEPRHRQPAPISIPFRVPGDRQGPRRLPTQWNDDGMGDDAPTHGFVPRRSPRQRLPMEAGACLHRGDDEGPRNRHEEPPRVLVPTEPAALPVPPWQVHCRGRGGRGAHMAQRPSPYFFRGFLCFASHYAKHGVPLGMTPSGYLHQMERLLRQPPLQPKKGCLVHKGRKETHGWLLYFDVSGSNVFIKTVFLKEDFHPRTVHQM
uniref:Reverse transcriptase Ty1/copia-type domain-containing protein n=1 Tax=Steinernema glaseri TaxID=37863 RepID=A0A1I7YKN4_9BILA